MQMWNTWSMMSHLSSLTSILVLQKVLGGVSLSACAFILPKATDFQFCRFSSDRTKSFQKAILRRKLPFPLSTLHQEILPSCGDMIHDDIKGQLIIDIIVASVWGCCGSPSASQWGREMFPLCLWENTVIHCPLHRAHTKNMAYLKAQGVFFQQLWSPVS